MHGSKTGYDGFNVQPGPLKILISMHKVNIIGYCENGRLHGIQMQFVYTRDVQALFLQVQVQVQVPCFHCKYICTLQVHMYLLCTYFTSAIAYLIIIKYATADVK